MATTTIRVDVRTHARLAAISKADGATLADTVRAATEALTRARYAATVKSELADLAEDPAAWEDYLTDAEATAVPDGLR
jgi:predicted DNA-binding protein